MTYHSNRLANVYSAAFFLLTSYYDADTRDHLLIHDNFDFGLLGDRFHLSEFTDAEMPIPERMEHLHIISYQ